MKPKMFVRLGVFLAVASLLSTSAFIAPVASVRAEPQDTHSVSEALNHALFYLEQAYGLRSLTDLVWNAGLDHRWDLYNATHIVFTSNAEDLSEIQGCYAINPCHAGFTTRQLTVIVHTPDDPQFSHQVTLIDSENHTTWSGKVDIDGHVTEYLRYR